MPCLFSASVAYVIRVWCSSHVPLANLMCLACLILRLCILYVSIARPIFTDNCGGEQSQSTNSKHMHGAAYAITVCTDVYSLWNVSLACLMGGMLL